MRYIWFVQRICSGQRPHAPKQINHRDVARHSWRQMEDSMGLLVFFGGGLLICTAIFYFAVYAPPAYVGLAAFLWAAKNGAGLGSPFVGLAVGVGVFLLAYFALGSRHIWLRFPVLAGYVLMAGFAGYSILIEIGEGLVPSTVWRHVFAVVFGIVAGIVAFRRLAEPSFARKHLPQG
jgi:hypothetical protein